MGEDGGLYGLIGSVLVAIITGYFSVKLSKRGSRAGEDANRIDQGVNSVGGFVELVKQQSVAIESLTERQKMLEGAQEVNDRITQGLRERIQKISSDLDSMHMWKRAALRYILELRAHGLKHAKEEELPMPPVELMGDLRDGEAA